MNVLSSQSSQTIEVGSSDVPKPVERRKWTTQEDIVLISAWLNTSKNPKVSNQQKLGSFWERIEEYLIQALSTLALLLESGVSVSRGGEE